MRRNPQPRLAGRLSSLPPRPCPIDASQTSRCAVSEYGDIQSEETTYQVVPGTCDDLHDILSERRGIQDEHDMIVEQRYSDSEGGDSAAEGEEKMSSTKERHGQYTPPTKRRRSVCGSSPQQRQTWAGAENDKEESQDNPIPQTSSLEASNESIQTFPPRITLLRPVPKSAPRTIEKMGRFTFRKGVRISDYKMPRPAERPDCPESPSWQCRDGFDADETSLGTPRPLAKRLKLLSNTPVADQ
ncbi:hypothetical protein CDD82_7726 [Ophiocordyceps australis]|uniref:Uncharacterized protein n=1 Tax=Ophiocordyceps australis TaxID=1399860 RepID=A0A2C5Y1T2_9HYPO|nr:hypothetical protein CDD82_7726 [Ophiocordyceps australis]